MTMGFDDDDDGDDNDTDDDNDVDNDEIAGDDVATTTTELMPMIILRYDDHAMMTMTTWKWWNCGRDGGRDMGHNKTFDVPGGNFDFNNRTVVQCEPIICDCSVNWCIFISSISFYNFTMSLE